MTLHRTPGVHHREELGDWDVDLADITVAQGALGAEEHVEGAGTGRRDAERGVLDQVTVAGAVSLDPLPRQGVARERQHGVDFHLGQQVHILEVLGRDQRQLQRPRRRHGRG